MSGAADAVLLGQCHALRGALHVQRRLIARQIDVARDARSVYPRSVTMRLLTGRRGITVGLFAEAAFLLFGSRYLRSLVATGIGHIAARLTGSRV